jgi:formiminoglutamase
MEFSLYFDPVVIVESQDPVSQELSLGSFINIYTQEGIFPSLEKAKVALIGVPEDRMAKRNEGCAKAPDQVRRYLYNLSSGSFSPNIVDLGNIKRGDQVSDTYFALSAIVSDLLKQNIVPIIIGGGNDLTYAQYKAYQSLEQIINIVAVDARFDIGSLDDPLTSSSYLGKIILHQPNYLFNYSNIGYQSYFTDPASVQLMNKLFFDSYRVGQVREDMEEVEPVMRNADMLSFDLSAVRQSDAPGNFNASPNGFYGEEACRILRYAGLSEKITSVGIYELNPLLDREGQTAHLVAQMIWYFLEGFYHRKPDNPLQNKQDFVKYRVALKEDQHEIVFHKSNKSGRWWMEVPLIPKKGSKYERHHLVPCSYKDYQTACNVEMPDRWWKAYQKLC